jgi:hypothetical protein
LAAKRRGIEIDQPNDVQPKENSDETSDYLSIAGSKLRRIEHGGSKRRCLRSRRLSRRLRWRRRRCGRQTSGYRAAAGCGCSPQGVLIPVIGHAAGMRRLIG